MISVHRIYLGRSWVASGEAGRLLSLFDELPEFLHAVVSLPDSGSEIETGDSVQRRAAVKVAMTQSHVALMWGGSEDPAPDWTEHELHVAGAGFRSRIPVLAVVAPGNEPASPIIRRLADRTVGWSSLEIARAVQELAGEAAAQRRIELEQLSISLSREDRAAHRAIASAAPDHGHMERRLPLTEIVAAYDRLKAGRTGKLQSS
jgi:hypothetical protein